VNLDGKTLSAWIQKSYGIELKVRQCQRLFRHLQVRLRKPRPVLAKADPRWQKKHKKTSEIDEGRRDRPVDEVHFQQQDRGAVRGCKPRTLSSITISRARASAVFRRETGRFNESFWEFLKVFRDVSAVAVPARVGQQRQCATSPLQVASTLAPSAGSLVRLGVPSALQSRVQSHRTSLETHPSAMPPQSVFWIPGGG
jgi:hypothetical protein